MIEAGQTYWSRSGRPLYCDGEIVQSKRSHNVGKYMMQDLWTATRFVAHKNGIATKKRHHLDVVTVLHPIMALEMVVNPKGKELNY